MTDNQDRARAAQDAAQAEAGNVAGKAQDATREVTDTARQEARQVTDEALGQAKSLASSAQDELNSQASTQQKRLAEQSRTVTDDLQRISRGEQPESDMVNQFVSMLADRAEKFTTQLETKEPADLLKDVRRFAARRPSTFLAIAAGVGLVAGRFTRGLSDNDDDQQQSSNRKVSGAAGQYQVGSPTGQRRVDGSAGRWQDAQQVGEFPGREQSEPPFQTPDPTDAGGFDRPTANRPRYGETPAATPDGPLDDQQPPIIPGVARGPVGEYDADGNLTDPNLGERR